MSQGGSRATGASRLVYQTDQNTNGGKQRATSAYGNSSRRNLPHTQNNFIVKNLGTHQKALIDNMKDQKNQMKNMGDAKDGRFAATILGLPASSDQHVLSGDMNNSIGIIGLSQSRITNNRPVSRDSKVRTAQFSKNNVAQN